MEETLDELLKETVDESIKNKLLKKFLEAALKETEGFLRRDPGEIKQVLGVIFFEIHGQFRRQD